MSRENIKRPQSGAICSGCGGDLRVPSDPLAEDREPGHVYCTNPHCRHYRTPHPTKWWLNAPGHFRKLTRG